MADVTLTIDSASVTVPAGTTILKAAEKLGRRVPTICYHEHCTANGLCRICVVEVDGVKPLLPACLSRVSEAMKVSTSSARAQRSFSSAGDSKAHRGLSRRPLALSGSQKA